MLLSPNQSQHGRPIQCAVRKYSNCLGQSARFSWANERPKLREVGPVYRAATLQATTASNGNQQSDFNFDYCTDHVKIIGIGQRSSKIAARFIKDGIVSSKRVWHVDLESRCDELPEIQQKLLLATEKEYRWAKGTDLSDLFEHKANVRMAGDKRAGNSAVLAFVLVTAGNLPGGPESVLCILDALRAAGHFTAVAITLPFDFEGRRRMDMADALAQALQKIADVVCIVEQNALMGVTTNSDGSPMTVADATFIADNAQENLVKLVLGFSEAEEIMGSHAGTSIWHHHANRTSVAKSYQGFPPALTDALQMAERSALGRGAASLSRNLGRMAAGQSLMQLATDSVVAAADSPFLEHLMPSADSIACLLILPRNFFTGKADSWPVLARLAAQAAAGAILRLSPCQNVFIAYQICNQVDQVQASMLLMFNDSVRVSNQHKQGLQTTSLETCKGQDLQRPTSQHQVASSRQPPSSGNWKALSAMAGGTTLPTSSTHSETHSRNSSSKQGVQKMITVAINKNAEVPDSVGDILADSLIAQSLDLPPKAAKWRQAQRARGVKPRMMVQAPETAWQTQEDDDQSIASTVKTILGGENQRVDVRQRMFAILERDRDDSQ